MLLFTPICFTSQSHLSRRILSMFTRNFVQQNFFVRLQIEPFNSKIVMFNPRIVYLWLVHINNLLWRIIVCYIPWELMTMTAMFFTMTTKTKTLYLNPKIHWNGELSLISGLKITLHCQSRLIGGKLCWNEDELKLYAMTNAPWRHGDLLPGNQLYRLLSNWTTIFTVNFHFLPIDFN